MDGRDAELYAKHAEELIRFATTLVGPSDAEDVMANAVTRAMTSPQWAVVGNPRAYLFRAVLNEARQLRRGDRRRLAREVRTAPSEPGGDNLLGLEIRDAMERLSLRHRSVLHLAYWHELSVAEIATELGLSRRSIERTLTQARRILEEQLG